MKQYVLLKHRSSPLLMFFKIRGLKIFAKFTEKQTPVSDSLF